MVKKYTQLALYIQYNNENIKNYINHKKYFFSFISLFSIFIVCYAVLYIQHEEVW